MVRVTRKYLGVVVVRIRVSRTFGSIVTTRSLAITYELVK
jgi:hypothetical protein